MVFVIVMVHTLSSHAAWKGDNVGGRLAEAEDKVQTHR